MGLRSAGSSMEASDSAQRKDDMQGQPEQRQAPASSDLMARLALPEEVTTQQAAVILGCCKRTVLRYLQEGLLEWRNAAPPSSNRPVFRFTLRSVLELRLGYQRGSLRLPAAERNTTRQRVVPSSGFQPKHVRRKPLPKKDEDTER
jgi:hypothetical protein